MNEIWRSQAFFMLLTLGSYMIGSFLYKKTKFALFNPLLVASVIIIVYLLVFRMDVEAYLVAVNGINLFLGPMIVALALPIYLNRLLIKKHIIPILVGVAVGSIVSMASVFTIGKIFQVDFAIIMSVIPKSSTAAIAMEISNQIGGFDTITIAVTSMTAVFGAVVLPSLLKLLKIKDPLIIGLSLGTTSHALGTAKALEINEEAGAISGIGLVFSGIMTVMIALLF
ncbi:MAG: LrgB family protein [Bacilli bacterium]